ncbi:class I adenylate-forming enzyme family protein [Henriciella litoralis]|uniref:class I adenylate-forming enzyme family protein n=1 Tax=Henriciella litoralis TaxID=568102 RepID=UPI000A025268|nr:class I adenylate-forming enzyme family protein [Henriciella litoralis]
MSQAIVDYVTRDFGTLSDLVALQAAAKPDHLALVHNEREVSYGELDDLINRFAAALQANGYEAGGSVAICGLTSIEYVVGFLGTLRAGMTVAPLAPSSTPTSLADMIRDSGAKLFLVDAASHEALAEELKSLDVAVLRMDQTGEGSVPGFLAPAGTKPAPVEIDPDLGFNIIYSSGTTGTPKGIVQSHQMRWGHCRPMDPPGHGPDAITMVSTPLYSNTTLVSFIPTLSGGGTAILMEKFNTEKFLKLAEKWRATHAMLVPVQYQRLMDFEGFDDYDLSSFVIKFCTSAPFTPELKAEVLKRFPGGLVEYYGMTEGGGSCMLVAHEHPDKLHTVGQPIEGHDIRIIDEDGNMLPPGQTGEIVGSSEAIMNGYHNQPGKTAEAEWYSPEGTRFIRTGDVGRFDEDGFITLMDRKKDMIISGGFNIYPSDIELLLRQHEDVADVAVVGVPSRDWGETPIAFAVLTKDAKSTAEDIREWANSQLGKTQRIADFVITDDLPRSAIGKVLKRELRDIYGPAK